MSLHLFHITNFYTLLYFYIVGTDLPPTSTNDYYLHNIIFNNDHT